MHHTVRALLIILPLTACSVIQTRPAARTSTDAGLETTSPPVLRSTIAQRGLVDSIVDADDQIADGPKTERAVGIAALAAEVIALTIIFIGFYKLAKMLY